MRAAALFLSILFIISLLVSFVDMEVSLRRIYSRPANEWPSPLVAEEVQWKELGSLPKSPIDLNNESTRQQVALGKILFFDTRLSGSGKISCATCHQPSLHWTDTLSRSLGHEGAINKRNSPTIQNVWFYEHLFWDGRSASLEDQAFAPINNESEMHGDMPRLSRKLRRIEGYPPLFKKAFGDEGIDPDRITEALAAFQRTISSAPSRFDEFVNGNKNALSKQELRGLHIFRTKAGCMNCHHGPMFSDNLFHNNGFAGDDVGRYFVSHDEADMGNMKTPSLRDVVFTGPWMHDGSQKDLAGIVSIYDAGLHHDKDPLIRPLQLSRREKADLLAFLHAISAPAPLFNIPEMP